MSLKNLLFDVYRKRQEEFKPESDNEIWVSWLSECQVKREQVTEDNANPYWLIRGIVTHIGVQTFLKDEVADVEKKVEYPIEVDGKQYVLKGSIDVVLKDGTIVELKTSRRNPGVFYPQHVFQLQLYMFMLNVERGLLVYLTPDDAIEYMITPDGVPGVLVPFQRITREYLVQVVHDYLSHRRIAPFNECSTCFLRNSCRYRK
jgi:CRISPR/Cas system-associated exonuclease Cas4 (RecB family)